MTWMERCLAGTSRPDDIDDFIGRWHDGDGQGMRLHEYLGLTWDEYARWAEGRSGAEELVRGRSAAGDGGEAAMTEPGPSPAVDWDGTIEAMNLAGGLCHSEAHRMEAAHRPTAEHWRSVATRLHGGALALAAWAAKAPPDRGEDRLATVEAVVVLNDVLALARCRPAPEPGSGPATACIHIHRDRWPSSCWPPQEGDVLRLRRCDRPSDDWTPAKGDVLRIREAPAVTLEARPR